MFEKSLMGDLNELSFYRTRVESAWRYLYDLCDPRGNGAKLMPTELAAEVDKTVHMLNSELDRIDEQIRQLRGRMI